VIKRSDTDRTRVMKNATCKTCDPYKHRNPEDPTECIKKKCYVNEKITKSNGCVPCGTKDGKIMIADPKNPKECIETKCPAR